MTQNLTIHRFEEGALLLHAPVWLPAAEADLSFQVLRAELHWEQKPIKIFGHERLEGRLTAFYGDEGINYKYSGQDHEALAWHEQLVVLRDRLRGDASFPEEFRAKHNACLLNLYRSGADSVGWHSDDERGMSSVIASLSLGATRRFVIRNKQTKEEREFPAEHGTLFIMAGTMQTHWKHCVPKTAQDVGERINLTYREFHR